MGDFWLALLALSALIAAIARMKAAGLAGLVRTKILWEAEDGTTGEVPFFTFRL